MTKDTNLLWAYDPNSGSFGVLPAGPLLLPALGILVFVTIARALKGQGKSASQFLGSKVVNSNAYKEDKARFNYLVSKGIQYSLGNGPDLEIHEYEEKRRLARKWVKGGSWSYR